MRKRKAGQPAGTDLDWFVIPIQKIRQWGLISASSSWPGSLATSSTVGAAAPRRSGRASRSPKPRACSPAPPARSGPCGPAPTSRRRATSCGTRRILPGIALRGGLPPGGRVAVLLPARARRLGARRTGRRLVHLRRGRRLAAARGPLDLRAGAPAPAALRRRLRQGGEDGLGRDHVLRRHAVHDPPGLALRVPAAGVFGGRREPDQDRLGSRQRLHVQFGVDDRHRNGDRGDRPRLARVRSTWRPATRPR